MQRHNQHFPVSRKLQRLQAVHISTRVRHIAFMRHTEQLQMKYTNLQMRMQVQRSAIVKQHSERMMPVLFMLPIGAGDTISRIMVFNKGQGNCNTLQLHFTIHSSATITSSHALRVAFQSLSNVHVMPGICLLQRTLIRSTKSICAGGLYFQIT